MSKKDLAFEKERIAFRKQKRELEREIQQLKLQNQQFKQEIQAERSKRIEQQDWIERLLEFTELSKNEQSMLKYQTQLNKKIEPIFDLFSHMIGSGSF